MWSSRLGVVCLLLTAAKKDVIKQKINDDLLLVTVTVCESVTSVCKMTVGVDCEKWRGKMEPFAGCRTQFVLFAAAAEI